MRRGGDAQARARGNGMLPRVNIHVGLDARPQRRSTESNALTRSLVRAAAHHAAPRHRALLPAPSAQPAPSVGQNGRTLFHFPSAVR
jgi:hypothetical protein